MKQNISLALSVAALTFQVTVFIELSDQMKRLSTQVSGIQTEIIKIKYLNNIF